VESPSSNAAAIPVSISTAGGQVAVYKPDIAPLSAVTTTPEPPVVPYQYQPALFDVGQPAVAAPQPPPPPSPPVRRLSSQQQPDQRQQQQLPSAQQPNSKANSRANSRPLLYNKRRPSDGGEVGLSQVSRPFEYISKLSSFLSDRVFSSGDSNRRLGSNRADSTARPQLIRRRVPQPTHR
jgi:hypothetical protein